MFIQRLLTAIIGIPILLGALYFGSIYWQLIVLALVIVGLLEYARMAGPGIYVDYLLISGLSFLFLTYTGLDGFKLISWLFLTTFYYLLRASFGEISNFSGAFNLLGVLYVVVPFSFLWLVRAEFGFIWSIYGLMVTWLTDTGAYFGGIRYGKNKLIPRLSPKKTKEGAVFGVVTALIGGIVFSLIVEESLAFMSVLAILLSIVGQLGDLVESALKRERVVKDSGTILPGHGGILDRFDSLNFVFPLLFIILRLFY